MASSRKAPAARAAESAPDQVDAAVADALAALAAGPAGDAGEAPALLVAFSGGLDSTVLLDAVARVARACPTPRWRPVALHVHHGLQPVADAWPAHCAEVAAALDLPFEHLRVRVEPGREGVEAAARDARYAAIAGRARALGARVVLTAHHLDDQLETLLMRLARGTGLDGLAGIPADAPFVAGGPGCRLVRPLLGLDRATLVDAARARGLRWIDDPSNDDPRFTRNAVRARLLPALDDTLPGWRRGFARAAGLLGEARVRLAQQADEDLLACRMVSPLRAPTGDPAGAGRPGSACVAVVADGVDGVDGVDRALGTDGTGGTEGADLADRAGVLDAVRLGALPPARRRAALRAWVAALGVRAPDVRRLDEIDRLAIGRGGEVVHEGWRLRAWQGRIDAARLAGVPGRGAPATPPPDVAIVWRGEPEIVLPDWGGRLRFEHGGQGAGPGFDPAWLAGRALRVSGRRDRARMRTAPGACRHDLKALYQARGVPPWARPTLPLVFDRDRLLFAAGIGVDHDAVARAPGTVQLRWCPTGANEGRTTGA